MYRICYSLLPTLLLLLKFVDNEISSFIIPFFPKNFIIITKTQNQWQPLKCHQLAFSVGKAKTLKRVLTRITDINRLFAPIRSWKMLIYNILLKSPFSEIRVQLLDMLILVENTGHYNLSLGIHQHFSGSQTIECLFSDKTEISRWN